MSNQAKEAGRRADEIIKQLANPSAPIETEQSTVKVLDQAVPVPSTPDGAQQEREDWEKRFKNYKSSTDLTLHNLRQKVSEFDLVQSTNESLQTKLEEVKSQIPKTPSEMLELFSPEEVDSFSKMVDTRVDGLQEELSRVKAELTKVRETDEADAEARANQYIIDEVMKAVPKYNEINFSTEFKEYLSSLDSFGNVRYDMLVRAKNSNPPDIGRIVQFYNEFDNTRVSPQAQEKPQYTQQELLQNPRSLSSERIQNPKGLGIKWDLPTIERFYKDKKMGKIPPDIAKELEQDMYKK